MDLIDENAARKYTIHKHINTIYEMYGRDPRIDGHITVFAGNHPEFK